MYSSSWTRRGHTSVSLYTSFYKLQKLKVMLRFALSGYIIQQNEVATKLSGYIIQQNEFIIYS